MKDICITGMGACNSLEKFQILFLAVGQLEDLVRSVLHFPCWNWGIILYVFLHLFSQRKQKGMLWMIFVLFASGYCSIDSINEFTQAAPLKVGVTSNGGHALNKL